MDRKSGTFRRNDGIFRELRQRNLHGFFKLRIATRDHLGGVISTSKSGATPTFSIPQPCRLGHRRRAREVERGRHRSRRREIVWANARRTYFTHDRPDLAKLEHQGARLGGETVQFVYDQSPLPGAPDSRASQCHRRRGTCNSTGLALLL